MNKFKCFSCQSEACQHVLNLGDQPVSNRFKRDPQEVEEFFNLTVAQCQKCGLIQLKNSLPPEALTPLFGWITYQEAEDHLDDLVEILSKLDGVSQDAVIGGISFKDDSTLQRFGQKGFKNIWHVDLKKDLEIFQAGSGVEAIQQCLSLEKAQKIVQQKGHADILVVRHILEHAHNPKGFVEALKELIHPGGYIVFEVPGCQKGIQSCDYTTIWEEHTLYFTKHSLKNFLGLSGLNLEQEKCYPYPFEDSLVAIVKKDDKSVVPNFDKGLQKSLNSAETFFKSFSQCKEKSHKLFKGYQSKGKVAFLGAGHLASAFINYFKLQGLIDFVVDDNPCKKGLFIPGSPLAIRPSQALLDEGVKTCLLSLNPANEEKVVTANKSFVDQGGIFLSIFRQSKRTIDIWPDFQGEQL